MAVIKKACVFITFTALFFYLYLFITWKIQFEYNTLTARKSLDFYNFLSWSTRNISEFIHPERSTCLVCPEVPQVCKDGLESNRTIFFVTTSPNNRLQRNAIRSTWAQRADPKPIFLTGRSPDAKTMNLLIEEALSFNDIVVEDFTDSYVNLTLKTGFMMKNFLRTCPKAKYLMKCDDDVMVNPDVIYSLVEKISGSNKPLIGRLFLNPAPFRDADSKYYIPYWLYDKSVFPPYLSGPGYLVPGDSVERILEESANEPLINLEDVYFTGMIAMGRLNMTLQNSKRFSTIFSPRMGKCNFQRAAMVHHLEVPEMLSLWNSTWDTKVNCKNKFRSIITGFGIPPFFLKRNSLDLDLD